jgi:hypothetical protein
VGERIDDEGGAGGYPVRGREMYLPINSSRLGDNHASANWRSGGN